MHKKGFTLLELILVIGMLAIIAATVIVAINPTNQLSSARDAARRQELREIENALEQYIIDGNVAPTIPTGIGNAKEICQSSVTGNACTVTNDGLDLATILTPDYLVDIPIDPNETGSTLTSYYLYKSGAFYETCSPTLDPACAAL